MLPHAIYLNSAFAKKHTSHFVTGVHALVNAHSDELFNVTLCLALAARYIAKPGSAIMAQRAQPGGLRGATRYG